VSKKKKTAGNQTPATQSQVDETIHITSMGIL